ncbi:MAG: hypothetical protein ACTHOU_09375 [Aureliella sp.]
MNTRLAKPRTPPRDRSFHQWPIACANAAMASVSSVTEMRDRVEEILRHFPTLLRVLRGELRLRSSYAMSQGPGEPRLGLGRQYPSTEVGHFQFNAASQRTVESPIANFVGLRFIHFYGGTDR